MYQVEVHWAPAHELVVSLAAFLNKKGHKLTDLGAPWASKVKKQLTPGLLADLADLQEPDLGSTLHLLVAKCPESTVAGFLTWLAQTPTGAHHAELLARWNEQYFQNLNPAVLAELAAEAESRRALVAVQSPQEAVEAATNGIVLDPILGLARVVLVPAYHHRPLNLFQRMQEVGIYIYPVPDAAAGAGQTPPGLMRVLRALTDESRLTILRHVAVESRSFMEIVKHSGLALSTVHHHLVALRAAGLVRVHEVTPGPGTGQNYARYTFRPAAVAGLGPRLIEIIQGGPRT